jgi:hypothetical protein
MPTGIKLRSHEAGQLPPSRRTQNFGTAASSSAVDKLFLSENSPPNTPEKTHLKRKFHASSMGDDGSKQNKTSLCGGATTAATTAAAGATVDSFVTEGQVDEDEDSDEDDKNYKNDDDDEDDKPQA